VGPVGNPEAPDVVVDALAMGIEVGTLLVLDPHNLQDRQAPLHAHSDPLSALSAGDHCCWYFLLSHRQLLLLACLPASIIVDMSKKRSREITVPELASRGGDARAKSLTPERRAEISRAAALSRWGRRPLPTAPIPDWEFSPGEKITEPSK
jgi:hypothetical protein